MWEFVIQRLTQAFIVLFAASILSFVIIELPPGNYLSTLQIRLEEEGMDQEQIQAALKGYSERYGLEKPWMGRYWSWISSILRGDLGYSMMMRDTVSNLISERLWLTMLISLITLLFSIVVAVPIGMYSAIHQYSWGDYLATLVGFLGLATPNFLLALVFMFLSVTVFGVSSIGGLFSPDYVFASWSWGKLIDLLQHGWIVILIIGTAGTAGTIRVVRATMLDTLNEPYIDTARMKGISDAALYFKHGLRVAINPVISGIGLSFPSIISGSAIVSIVLTLPLIGPLLLRSLMSEDMYLASTILFFLTVALVVGNLLADLALAWLDPRIRHRA